MTPSDPADRLRAELQRVTDHLEAWANDHSDDRTSETDSAIWCAHEALRLPHPSPLGAEGEAETGHKACKRGDSATCRAPCSDVDGCSYCDECGLWEGARSGPFASPPPASAIPAAVFEVNAGMPLDGAFARAFTAPTPPDEDALVADDVANWRHSRAVLLDRAVPVERAAAMIRDGDRLAERLSALSHHSPPSVKEVAKAAEDAWEAWTPLFPRSGLRYAFISGFKASALPAKRAPTVEAT